MNTTPWVRSDASPNLFIAICRRLFLTDRRMEPGNTWLNEHLLHVLGAMLLCLVVLIGLKVKDRVYEAGFVPVTKANCRDSTFQRIQSDQGQRDFLSKCLAAGKFGG